MDLLAEALLNYETLDAEDIRCWIIQIQYLDGYCIQWGSEYQTSLVFEWSKRVWMPNDLVFECHLNTEQPNHLNTGLMDAILFSYVLVQYLNGWSST